MALESCKTLALFDYRFFCVRKGRLRSDGYPYYKNLNLTLELKIEDSMYNGVVRFSCDLMPINLVKFNTEMDV